MYNGLCNATISNLTIWSSVERFVIAFVRVQEREVVLRPVYLCLIACFISSPNESILRVGLKKNQVKAPIKNDLLINLFSAYNGAHIFTIKIIYYMHCFPPLCSKHFIKF